MNLLLRASVNANGKLDTPYRGVEADSPMKSELKSRLLSVLVGCLIISGTLVYVVPVLAWLKSGDKYTDILKYVSTTVHNSLFRPEGEYLTMVLGLLAVGATLFALSAGGSKVSSRGEQDETEAFTFFVNSFNALLSVLFMIAFMFAVNSILLKIGSPVKSLIISAVSFGLCYVLASIRGTSAYRRRAAVEYNKECRQMLLLCLERIPQSGNSSNFKLYGKPLLIAFIALVLQAICLIIISPSWLQGFASGATSLIYISIAVALETYRRVSAWNETKIQKRSSRILASQIWSLVVLSLILPAALIADRNIREFGAVESFWTVLAGISLLMSVAMSFWYIARSRAIRDLIYGKQKSIVQQRVRSIESWIDRQEEWLAEARFANQLRQ